MAKAKPAKAPAKPAAKPAAKTGKAGNKDKFAWKKGDLKISPDGKLPKGSKPITAPAK